MTQPDKPSALLLDLGNVVIHTDARRVFAAWAASAGVDQQVFLDRWRADEAYARHEIGELRFQDYVLHMQSMTGVTMSQRDWKAGWNELFVALYPRVLTLLRRLAGKYPLYAFTNTNPTHEHSWRSRYPELDVFEHVFVSSRIGRRKPHVDAYHYVCKRMQQQPDKIWFLDDNRANVEGACQAGLKTFRIRSEQDVVDILSPLLAFS
ncbi:MAG: HAD family phosphatase [Pseudomonadales bacterium]|nr:HAD family phosphatase [Pseudomonadales bacterium]